MDTRCHRIVVPRSARYFTLGSLDGPVRDLWLVCHGYRQLGEEFLRSAAALAHPERLVVAPEALSRFYHEDHETIGASWMTREDRDAEMDDYVRYLDLVHDAVVDVVARADVRLTVLGYSQGAATAARWTVRGRGTVDHLVLWGGALPPELDDAESLASLSAVKLSLVAGARDALFPEAAREEQRERLARHRVSYAEFSFDGGHRLDDDTLRTLAAG